MDDGYNRTRQKLAALAGQRAATEEERLRYRVAELEAGAESLRSSLRAAEAERDEARDIVATAGANLGIDVDRPQDIIMHIEMLRDGLARLRAAEERAEAAERWLAGVREDFRLYAINAERRAEGLADALKKAHEAGLALLGWIAVCDMQGVVPNRNSVLAQNARAALARPRSEDAVATPVDPDIEWADTEGLDMPPDGSDVGFRHNMKRAHPCDFACGGRWVCIRCRAEWREGEIEHGPKCPRPRSEETPTSTDNESKEGA